MATLILRFLGHRKQRSVLLIQTSLYLLTAIWI